MQRSRGFKSRSRKKLTKRVRPGENGDMVHIIIDPSIQKGQPHSRFHGKTAKVVDKKGKAYILALKDGNKAKELIVTPEHLKLQEWVQWLGKKH